MKLRIDRIFREEDGKMFVYEHSTNGIIWDFTEFDYDPETEDYTIEVNEGVHMDRSYIENCRYGKEFLAQF